MVKKMVFPNYDPCYGPSRLLVVNKMVFANHINCYNLEKLFIVTGKLYCWTIILVVVPPDYICG
jgi:hypothetical protein